MRSDAWPVGRLHRLGLRTAQDRELLVGLVALVVLAAVVAGWGLGAKPFWNDEAASAQFATLSFGGLIETLGTREYIMALYQLLLWPWSRLFGTSEVMLRLPSLILGLAALPVTVLVARRVLEPRWALMAGLFVGLSGFFVHYAQEARGYSLLMLMAVLSLWTLLRAVESPTYGRWLVYAAIAITGVWSQPVMGFLIAGQVLAVVLHPQARHWWRQAALAYAVVAVAVLPLGLAIVLLGTGRWEWIGDASVAHFIRQMNVVAGHGDMPHLALWALAWTAGAVACVVAWLGDRRRHWAGLLVAASALAVLAGPFVVSFVRPMFIARYLIAALPALMILATVFLSSARERAVAGVLIIALLAVSLDGVHRWYFEVERADWRSATGLVVERQNPADGIAFFTGSTVFAAAPRTYRYYLTQQSVHASSPRLIRLAAGVDASLEERIHDALRDRARLWAVGPNLSRGRSGEALELLVPRFELAESIQFGGGLDVRLYVRRPSAGGEASVSIP